MAEHEGVEAARAEIEAGLVEVCGQLNVAHARLVDLVAQAIASSCWEGAGILSCQQWVAWKTGLSPARAHDLVALASRRGELPETFTAFTAGAVSVDQVTVVARHAPAAIDAEVAVLAQAATVSQLRRSLRHHHFDNAGEEGEPAGRPDPCRVSGGFGPDGRYRLRAVLDPVDGALVDQALREARDALFQEGEERVTGTDALVEMARRSLDKIGSPSRRERFTVVFHIPVDGTMYLHDGPAVPNRLARQVLCDAAAVIVGIRDGRPVTQGRRTRIVPDLLRRVIEDRDRGCRVPGCTNRRVQIHHIVHWEDGGATDPDNLLALCPRHHRLLHRGLLSIEAIPNDQDDPDRVEFRDRRGRPLPGTTPPTPPLPGAGPQVAGRWRHPTGERLHTKWLTFNTPPAPTAPAPQQTVARC